MSQKPPSQRDIPESLRALLANLIDYAGLFPPAGLGMCETVANYTRYRAGRHAWILGRLMVPANRLAEFEQAQSAMGVKIPWRLSCPMGTSFQEDLLEIRRFRGRTSAMIESVETKLQNAADVSVLTSSLPAEITIYFEVPPDCSAEILIEIKRLGARAKLRTGGSTPAAIPPIGAVAGFLTRCASTGTLFKATAGLHQAVRRLHPLTHEASSACTTVHGFLNVFLAAMLAFHKAPLEQLSAIIGVETPDYFKFENAVARCGSVPLGVEQIQTARENFAVSFGSCSFEEPIESLQSLGLL